MFPSPQDQITTGHRATGGGIVAGYGLAVAGIHEATAGVGATVIIMEAGVIAAEWVFIMAASIVEEAHTMAAGIAVVEAVTAMVGFMVATGKRLFFLARFLCPAVET